MGANKKQNDKVYSEKWGGARENSGRKKLDSEIKKSKQIAFRVSDSEFAEVSERALKAGVSVSKYVYSLVFQN